MEKQEKKPLVILTGPTAVGKTDLSIALAKAISGAVISADSMQVYRGMDIGSAKITAAEMGGVPHYLIDVLNPDEEFHVVRFQEMARQALAQIYAAGQIPIVVGGTGFYIQALLYDIDFTEQDGDPAFREELERIADQEGAHALHERLRCVDPVSAEAIHENNVKRVIRALEFYEKSGEPISAHNERERQKESPYNFCYFVLNDDRERVYERIDRRVDRMLADGLV
ncbi:MAG: tRNA (adenosine(37)-N6)-dimethylallyltransferase MiaA, partial [Lachnospiraceae bacterium]|nr:tRNA (adenosine(37)-N6)-dimethylallyltransferase MiaA [Lachnospiraceae bacterium]